MPDIFDRVLYNFLINLTRFAASSLTLVSKSSSTPSTEYYPKEEATCSTKSSASL